MQPKITNKLLANLISLAGIVAFILLFILGLVFFSYLLIIGGIIGLILFGIAWIRLKYFQHKIQKAQKHQPRKSHQGRTIDHDNL